MHRDYAGSLSPLDTPLGIEHAGLVKPLPQIDTDEELVVELVHERLDPWSVSACDVSSAPILAFETQTSRWMSITHEVHRHACPFLAFETQGEVWRCRRIADKSN